MTKERSDKPFSVEEKEPIEIKVYRGTRTGNYSLELRDGVKVSKSLRGA
jgi:hypothetical protein